MTGGASAYGDDADPVVPHGRRRESSRHRSTRWVGLPRWLAWTLRSGTPLISLVPVLVAVALVQSLSPLAQQLPVGDARFATTVGWALAHPGALSGFGHWFDLPSAGWLQLGLLGRVLLGGSAQSVLAAAHGAMLILTLAAVALVWACTRRAGASGLAAGGAAAAFGVAPMAVATHATVSEFNVAVPWLLVALLLASGPHRRSAAAASGAAGAMAVLSAPPVLIAVPLIGWAWLRPAEASHGERPPPSPRQAALLAAVAFAVVLAAAVVMALVLGASAPTGPARTADALAVAAAQLRAFPAAGASAAVAWLTRDPLSLLIGLVAVILTARSRGLRPVAVLAGVVAVGSFWPAGRDPVGPVALLLMLFALTTAAAIDGAVVALGRPRFVVSLLGAGWLMGVAALLVVAAVVWLAALGAVRWGSDQPLSRAERWIARNVPARRVLLVDVAAWPDVSSSSAATVGWYAAPSTGSAPVPSSAPWTAADYVLATPALDGHVSGAAAAALHRSVAVARFGSGSEAVKVRAVRRPGPGRTPSPSPAPSPSPSPSPSVPVSVSPSVSVSASPSTAAERRAAAMRKQTGSELARNPRLILGGDARAELQAGEVDSRVSIVLGQLASVHGVTVAGFPAVPAEPAGPRRQVLISAVDGHPVPADATRTDLLHRYLSGLRGDFATASIDATAAGVLASFAPDPTFVPPS